VGGYWNRNNSIEVDVVGGDERAAARHIEFAGSVKWREERRFDRRDGAALVAARESIPGADAATRLLGVSRRGFERGSGLDIELGPQELLAAFRR
jgi:hypothetical protein